MSDNVMSAISVCMATYNGQEFLEQQIISVCNDLQDNDELVISDNGSNDDTLKIIKNLKDPRIKLVHSKKLGVNSNFANAVTHAKNEIVCFCDQDDIWYSGKRNICAISLQSCDLIMHNADIGKSTNLILSKLHKKKVDLTLRTTIMSNKFTGCCMAGKKDFILGCLPFPKDLPYFDQWVAVNAIAKRNKYIFLDECLIMHRRHGGNTSTLAGRSTQSLKNKIYQRLLLSIYILKYRVLHT